MATSFGALCSDFYVNHKLALKMDLPGDRETILHLFDRIKKTTPSMDRFHRYEGELVLESSRKEHEYRWISMRRTSVRTGHVNPQSMAQTYKYHKMVLEAAPFHLSVSPLDVDYLELTLGFDLECRADQDAVVYQALYAESPLGGVLKPVQVSESAGPGPEAQRVIDVQPVFGMALNERGDLQAYFEVRTRTRGRRGQPSRYPDEPLSLTLVVRQYGPVRSLDELGAIFDTLKEHAEVLAAERLVPDLLTPIARQIASSNA